MQLNDLHEVYVAELQELRDAEHQLAWALPQFARIATSSDVRAAIEADMEGTRAHCKDLDHLLRRHGVSAHDHQDGSMHAIIGETGRWVKMLDEGMVRDAGLIASAQRIKHYQIAVCGTLSTWAEQLALEQDAPVLRAILDAEKHTDRRLTAIAKSSVNLTALNG
jgi:ferritin-like metal-binding protein YciE